MRLPKPEPITCSMLHQKKYVKGLSLQQVPHTTQISFGLAKTTLCFPLDQPSLAARLARAVSVAAVPGPRRGKAQIDSRARGNRCERPCENYCQVNTG